MTEKSGVVALTYAAVGIGAVLANNIKVVPLSRVEQSDEVADVAAFLVNSISRYMTGAAFNLSVRWSIF